jgi:hypothetical protein
VTATEQLKRRAASAIEAKRELWLELSHRIHAHPELGSDTHAVTT